MIKVSHKRSKFGEALEKRAQNLEELEEAHDEALKVIEAQNAERKLDLGHRHTIVRKTADRISVGSESKTYAPLLTMDGEEVADVYRRKANED